MNQNSQLQRPDPIESEWFARSNYWLTTQKPTARRLRREREKHPLILTGHGLSLHVDKGCLLVRDGNTHYPSDRREWRFFKGSLELPPAFIILDGSGEITLDAMDWLATQDVPVIRVRWDGQFSSIVTSGGQAASSNLVRWQVAAKNRACGEHERPQADMGPLLLKFGKGGSSRR